MHPLLERIDMFMDIPAAETRRAIIAFTGPRPTPASCDVIEFVSDALIANPTAFVAKPLPPRRTAFAMLGLIGIVAGEFEWVVTVDSAHAIANRAALAVEPRTRDEHELRIQIAVIRLAEAAFHAELDAVKAEVGI